MPKSRKRKSGGGKSSRYTYSSNKKSQKRTKLIRNFTITALIVAGLAAITAVYLSLSGDSQAVGVEITTPSGLKYVDIVIGDGDSPRIGQTVTAHYTGTFEDGRKFDSSLDSGKPYSFVIGAGTVIKGWDEGILSMKVGGKRKLIVPPDLAYGASGRPGIPPNSTLLFDIELLSVQ